MSNLSDHQYIERARLLLNQKRYKDAETQAGMVLQADPENTDALQIIGHCRLDNKKYEEAITLFQQCLGKEPDDDYAHYLLAFAYYHKDNHDLALKYIEQAIALFPYNAGYFSLLSNIQYSERKYADALYAANKGLEINSEDTGCLNARSAALFRLNKKEEAYQTIHEALQVNPENAYTHINYGWHFLEKGHHKKAHEHFKEALRLNPNNESARQGYKASLKARLPFYRWILQYSLWVNRQSKAVRIFMIFGIWILVRAIAAFSDSSNVWLRYFAGGIVFLYLAFVFLSWLGDSLANLYLLATPHGKYALSKSEKWSARLVGISLLLGITQIIAGIILQQTTTLVFAGAILASMSIPLSSTDFPVRLFKGSGRQVTLHLLLLLGSISVLCFLLYPPAALLFAAIYAMFFLGFMWTGSFKSI